MTAKTQSKLIARIFIDSNTSYGSECAKVGVSFNFIEKGDTTSLNPHFVSDFDLPKSRVGLDRIRIVGLIDAKWYMEKQANGLFGYQLESDAHRNTLSEAKAFVKVASAVDRKIYQIINSEGGENCMADYLVYAFRAMKVEAVLFETHSEDNRINKWTEHPIIDTPQLIDIACQRVAGLRHWHLKSA